MDSFVRPKRKFRLVLQIRELCYKGLQTTLFIQASTCFWTTPFRCLFGRHLYNKMEERKCSFRTWIFFEHSQFSEKKSEKETSILSPIQKLQSQRRMEQAHYRFSLVKQMPPQKVGELYWSRSPSCIWEVGVPYCKPVGKSDVNMSVSTIIHAKAMLPNIVNHKFQCKYAHVRPYILNTYMNISYIIYKHYK